MSQSKPVINIPAAREAVLAKTQSHQRSAARDELTTADKHWFGGDTVRAERFVLRALRAACGEWSAEYRAAIAPLTPAQASAMFGLSESEVAS